MKKKTPYIYECEHYEDMRVRLGVILKFTDTEEYASSGEHSAEKYLARLEARKKAAQEEKSEP